MADMKRGWVFWKDNSPHTKLAVNPAMLSGFISLETLVRELIQNSADAGTTEPVKMVVSDGTIEKSKVYGPLYLDDLRKHIQGTVDFAQSGNSEKRILPKSNGQLALLEQPSYKYLKFSDYGTKGMRGIEKYDPEQAFWKMLFQEGTSDKDSNSAGGVGVGKNATFPFSDIATVLYVTKTAEGFGFAGSAHLASSKIDGQTYETDGNLIAYSGSDEDILDKRIFDSIKPLDEADTTQAGLTLFDRSEMGSDVIILGTDTNTQLSDSEWPWLFAAFAIKNFFVAFLDGKIELTIKPQSGDEIIINKTSCDSTLDRIASFGDNISSQLASAVSEARLSISTYRGSPDNDDYFSESHVDDKLGKFTLYMNRSKDVASKQWFVCRSFGMRTVTESVRVQKPTFGFVVIETKEGSNFLLNAEAGNHTEYDFSAMGNGGSEAQAAIDAFEKWVKAEIANFGKIDSSTTDLELAGLSSFVALEDEIKTGDENGGTKPLMEPLPLGVVPSRSKRAVRKRDSNGPDQEPVERNKKVQWKHNKNHHHHWGDERDTETEGDEEKKASEKCIDVPATFRDTHSALSDNAEILGSIHSEIYKKVDVEISAVDEQSKINLNLPPIIKATDLNTGLNLAISKRYTLKDVPVSDLCYIHISVQFAVPFRAMLLEKALVKQEAAVDKTAKVQDSSKEEVNNESAK